MPLITTTETPPSYFVSYSWSKPAAGQFGFGWRVRYGEINTPQDVTRLIDLLESDFGDGRVISIISWQAMKG